MRQKWCPQRIDPDYSLSFLSKNDRNESLCLERLVFLIKFAARTRFIRVGDYITLAIQWSLGFSESNGTALLPLFFDISMSRL